MMMNPLGTMAAAAAPHCWGRGQGACPMIESQCLQIKVEVFSWEWQTQGLILN